MLKRHIKLLLLQFYVVTIWKDSKEVRNLFAPISKFFLEPIVFRWVKSFSVSSLRMSIKSQLFGPIFKNNAVKNCNLIWELGNTTLNLDLRNGVLRKRLKYRTEIFYEKIFSFQIYIGNQVDPNEMHNTFSFFSHACWPAGDYRHKDFCEFLCQYYKAST